MIAAEINEADYGIASSLPAWIDPGEYGPLACGCCLASVEIDPLGPRMVCLLMRRDAETHEHSLGDFTEVLPDAR